MISGIKDGIINAVIRQGTLLKQNPWNAISANRQKIKQFLSKLSLNTVDANNQLTIVMNGDSIFGRLASGEMADNGLESGLFPPNGWLKNVQVKLLDYFQFGNVNYYNETTSNITKGGIWTLQSNSDNCRFYTNSTSGSYFEITVTNVTFLKFIYKDVSGSNLYGPVSVTVNGGSLASAGITGESSFYNSKLQGLKWNNRIYSGLIPENTYTFRFTKTNNELSIWWGFETWKDARINIINTGVGGSTANTYKTNMQRFSNTSYIPDLIIHELPLLNNCYHAQNKGQKNPTSAGITPISGDFFYAGSTGIYVNYSNLSLTTGDTAQYNGSSWEKGSSNADALVATYNSNIDYLDSLAALNIPTVVLTPSRSTTVSLYPWGKQMLSIARERVKSNGSLAFIDLDKKYEVQNLNAATYVADGTHLNDAGVQLWVDTIKEIFI